MKRKPRAKSSAARKHPSTGRRSRLAALLVTVATFAVVTVSTVSLAQIKDKLVSRQSPQTAPAPASAASPKRSSSERAELEKDKGKERSAKRRSTRRAQQDQDGNLGDPQDVRRGRVRAEGRPREWRLRRGRTFKGDLRDLPQVKLVKMERPEREGPEPSPGIYAPPDANSSAEEAASEPAPTSSEGSPAPTPDTNFEGLDFNNNGNGHPPDTVGDVGPTYYIQAINTSVGIYNKATGAKVTSFTFNSLMSQGHQNNLCDTSNFGDPVILYDTFEDRWIITDFAFSLDSGANVINPPGAFQCFAVSRSGDPVAGGWNFYSINTAGGLGDYPKLGIWPDGLYMSVNMFGYANGAAFQGPRVYAFNKAQMYAGAPSVQSVSFNAPSADFTILPSNARLQTGTPSPGTPNYFLSTWQFLNGVSVYKFHVDWNNISLSTFTGPDVPTSATSWPNASVANAPSLGGNAQGLDVLQIRAMMQNQYTKIGGVESLWAIHTVRRQNTSGSAAPRFYQVNVTGGAVAANLTQAATYDPDGNNVMHRFMPSLAVDRVGNMAFGYSTSSSTTKPAIKYAGRLWNDPVNTFSQSEQVLIQGAGTQTGNCGGAPCTRWGDYSAMSLDPDGCKFWYTNMYYQTDGLNHHTYIGSFNLPQCTPAASGGIQGVVTSSAGGGPVAGATVALGSRTATTDATGFYSFSNLPAGTYPSITASFPGYTSSTFASIAVNEGATTTRDFTLGPGASSACFTDTTQTDFQKGVPTSVDITGSPGDVMLLNAPTIDQQNTTLGTQGASFTNTSWLGQTFTPAVTGQLTRVDVNFFSLNCSAVSMPNLTVSIRNASGNLPTGGDLATATVPGFCNGGGGYFTANFASPPTLNAGTQYAVVWRAAAVVPSGSPAPGYFATVSAGTGSTSVQNPYAGGRRVSSSNSGGTWAGAAGNANNDHGFIAYMKTGFTASGTLVSGLKDANPHAGGAVNWGKLTWNASTPAGTSLKLQVSGSNSANGPFTFVGPDGTAATFFNASGASLSQFNGLRYLKYQATLATTNNTLTPTLNDVTACFDDTVPTTLSVNSATGAYGGTVNLSATLTDGVSPLGGKTVSFTLNGLPVGSAVTDPSGVASLSNATLAGIGAGAYANGVGASFTADPTYLASTAANSLVVNKADATIAVTPYGLTYDGQPHTATATATGVNGESLTGFDLSGTTHTNAGAYNGDAWTFSNANYKDANGTVDDRIDKANATVNVTPYSVTYDANPHTATGTATGVNSESLAGLDLSGTTHTNAGTYVGDPWTFADVTGNYNNANGTVTDHIGQATPVITWNNPADIVYGTALGGAQLNAGASVPGSFVYTPAAGAVLSAGNGQTLHVAFTPTDAVNYTAASKNVFVNVLKATLSLTVDNKSKTYGDANPPLTYTPAGFVNGDTPATAFSGAPALSTPATQATGAGAYPINAAPGTLSSANYTFSFVPGTLLINKAALTVTADNKSKLLGAPLPLFTASYSGFVLADGPGSLGGALAFSTPATVASPVGAYPITPSGLTSPNYNITFVNGTLSVGFNVCVLFDQTQAKQSGSTIPVKLQLCTADGANQSSASLVVHAASVVQLPSNTPAALNDAGSANPGNDFRFDGGQYIFNLKTTGYAAGTYRLSFTVAGDPTAHTVQFVVR